MSLSLLMTVTIVIFLFVTLLLTAMLLFAKAKLTPKGLISIDINNGERIVEVGGGSTLLTTLSNNGVFLPSACGGGGTCVQCKCQVLEGGGEILPTEIPHFSRKQIADNWRLGCQVKVKENMKIHVEEEVLGIKEWEATVISNHNVATFIKEFIVGDCQGIGMNWRFFGSSGQKEAKTEEPLTKRFTLCQKDGNVHIKTLFKKHILM
jgi:Na+-transporting NADH:ubiquinone oxidoreductase subunit F